jgi:hypothetical protein
MIEILKRKIILWYYSKIIKDKKYSYQDSLKIALLQGIINTAKTNREKTKLFKDVLKEISEM